MFDYDGSFAYSEVRSVYRGEQPAITLNLYPNPAVDKITLEGSDFLEMDIRVVDMLGRDVTDYLRATGTSRKIEIDISYLANGLYFVVAGQQAIKFEKLKR